MSQFPSEWSLEKIQQSDNQQWTVKYFGGFPYFQRFVTESENKSAFATLECNADFRVTIMKAGDVVVLNPTDFSTKIKGSILPIVQALLLTMQVGDKIEAIAPAVLAYGDDSDVFVEIELKAIHNYTGVKFIYHPAEQQ